MSAETNPAVELEIAHVLFIDTVGYSKLLIDDQRDLLDRLNRIVKNTNQVRTSEAAGNLITLPTGDGMALVFSGAPEAPVQCALEISKAAQADLRLPLRMGIHSGPVSRVVDVNDRSNAAGAGINIAERVMGFGDAGHILLSKRAADDLAAYGHWRPFLHEIGEYEVKYGVKVSLVNLHKGEAGNAQLPARCKMLQHQAQRVKMRRRALYLSLPLLVISAVTAALLFPRANVADLSPKSIAVLPFENLSDEKENAFFTGGVQDEILSDLARVADLKVISRTSTMRYKSSPDRNLRQIAKELGVTYIVEGSVQRVGDHIRVSAQLIDARSDMHMWADRYDSDATDVFRIQSDVAQQVVAQLKAKLSPQEKAAIEEPPTDNLAAYDLYLRGRRLIDSRAFEARQKESLIEATRLLDEAIALDPQFVLAYYQLATAHDLIYFQGYDHTPARLAQADAAVNSLVRLRPASGEAHLALAQHLLLGISQIRSGAGGTRRRSTGITKRTSGSAPGGLY